MKPQSSNRTLIVRRLLHPGETWRLRISGMLFPLQTLLTCSGAHLTV